jgi:hypothetical protein
VEAPRIEAYGTVAVFEELYGNRRDLIQHSDSFGLGACGRTSVANLVRRSAQFRRPSPDYLKDIANSADTSASIFAILIPHDVLF